MLTESRELESIEYFPGRKAVNILWKDRVFRDGELLHEGDHRAALPVDDNGNLSPADEAKLGIKLKEILGDAGKEAAQKLARAEKEKKDVEAALMVEIGNGSQLSNSLARCQEDLQKVSDEKDALRGEKEQVASLVMSLESELELLKTENARLLKELEKRGDPIEVIKEPKVK